VSFQLRHALCAIYLAPLETSPLEPLLCIILIVFSPGYHLVNECEQECAAEKYYKAGRKKGHNKSKRVVQAVRDYKHLDSEDKEKAGCHGKDNLPYPPQDLCYHNMMEISKVPL
jgi:hypothetical protein